MTSISDGQGPDDATSKTPTAKSDELLALLVGAVDYAILMLDVDGRVAGWNAGAERIKGYRAEEILGRHFSDFYTAEDRASGHPEMLLGMARSEGRVEDEGWRMRSDGSRFWASVVITALRDERGELRGYAKVTRDLTERHEAEQRLRQSEQRFHAAFEHAPVGVALLDLRGPESSQFLKTNPALAQIVGREPDELEGTSMLRLIHPEDRFEVEERYPRLRAGDSMTVEVRVLHLDGREVWVLMSSTAVPGQDEQPDYCVTQLLDISDRRRFEGQLSYLADHDALTGLFNRHRFESELERVVGESQRYDRRLALLVLDLDGFRFINDRFGHPLGDKLVSRIARLLGESIRDTDIVARLGGDEFAIIVQEADELEAVTVAEKILDTVRRRGVVTEELQHARVRASVGITTCDAHCELNASELLLEADIAMYDAKAAGRDRCAVYHRLGDRHRAESERQSWLDRLMAAIDQDGFVLHAQPIAGICGNGMPRFELLLRMLDDHGNLMPPGAFLHNAERFDLMGTIDRWVLRQAARLLHDHTNAGNQLSLAVNLSGKTMNDPDLAADLAAIMAEYPVPAGRLVIEVTETAAIVNIDRARELARQLRGLGCRFALDDFGAGFASFYYLKHLEFDYLKIDGEFIEKLVDTPTDQLVVSAVVEIARGLGTETIAEFVGDSATVELLRSLGVDYGQGYHLGRPGPLAERLPAIAATYGAPAA